MTQNINIQIFNWGPCVIRMKITDSFKKLFLTEAEKNKLDYTDKLAGILEKETGYNEESKNIILPQLSQCLGVYNQAFEKYVNKIIQPSQFEINKNNPSRSAKLRYAIRSENKFSIPTNLFQKFKNYLDIEAINVQN